MVRTGVGAGMSVLGRGEGHLLAKSPPGIFVSVFTFFYFFLYFLINNKNTTATKSNKPMPLNKRPQSKQWILRTHRKAGISWYIPALCVSSPLQGEERKTRTRMGKLSCTVQYLFSSLGILVPSDPGFLSVRALEGLNLRIWYCMSVNCM